MEKQTNIRIEDFGGRVNTVWSELRPATRQIIERALESAPAPNSNASRFAVNSNYDARAEFELSRLLAALDDASAGREEANARAMRQVAETCVAVLDCEARSAEVFAQLLERAMRARDYRRVDALADILTKRLAPTEICELARSANVEVRAVAREALMQVPTSALVDLLPDPVDSEIVRDALEGQAYEFNSEEARWVVNTLEGIEAGIVEDEIDDAD